MNDLFTGLITSKTRIKLLVRFFFNPTVKSYLRELANEFDVSTNAVRGELSQLTKTELLISKKSGRLVYYKANVDHPLFADLKSMVSKAIGVDTIIDSIVRRLGELDRAYLLDDYAEGKDTGIIDLLLVGNIDPYHLNDLSRKTERYINRKIRSLVITKDEYRTIRPTIEKKPHLLIWEKNYQRNSSGNSEL
ncbi:MAG: ArsR family transcriptional regulator [Deltaproteobacteria bacterium]|nr:ArsR family transcriptional regulator [Deltaproteobacteria bacterium]